MKTRLEDLLASQFTKDEERKLEEGQLSKKAVLVGRAKSRQYNRIFSDVNVLDKEFCLELGEQLKPSLKTLKRKMLEEVEGLASIANKPSDEFGILISDKLDFTENSQRVATKIISEKLLWRTTELASALINLACATLLDSNGKLRPSLIKVMGLEEDEKNLKKREVIQQIILSFVSTALQDMGKDYLDQSNTVINQLILSAIQDEGFLKPLTKDNQKLLAGGIKRHLQADRYLESAQLFAKKLAEMKDGNLPATIRLMMQADFARCTNNLFLERYASDKYEFMRTKKLAFWRNVMFEYGVIHAADSNVFSALVTEYNKLSNISQHVASIKLAAQYENNIKGAHEDKRAQTIGLMDACKSHVTQQHLLIHVAEGIYQTSEADVAEDKIDEQMLGQLQKYVNANSVCIAVDLIVRSYSSSDLAKRTKEEDDMILDLTRLMLSQEAFDDHYLLNNRLNECYTKLQTARKEALLQSIAVSKVSFFGKTLSEERMLEQRKAKIAAAPMGVLEGILKTVLVIFLTCESKQKPEQVKMKLVDEVMVRQSSKNAAAKPRSLMFKPDSELPPEAAEIDPLLDAGFELADGRTLKDVRSANSG
ncbi:MAG: hypothetical protein ABI597_11655, partial [Gammaproteobacteria bacterium]